VGYRYLETTRSGHRAPTTTQLGGEQTQVDLVLVDCRKFSKRNDVGPDHLEDGEAAFILSLEVSAPNNSRLVQQPRIAMVRRLLMIRRISLRTTPNSGHY